MKADPAEQFRRWFDEAREFGVAEPHNMVVATASRDGRPSARMVILKQADARGFVFATSYSSRKAGELADNPHAALVLHWPQMGRQVRIEGKVERISGEESSAIFDARPLGSRLSAIASPQSEVVPDRGYLEARVEEVVARHRSEHQHVERPESWGGFRVVPSAIEFWQSGPNRLHDRMLYTREGTGWTLERLAP